MLSCPPSSLLPLLPNSALPSQTHPSPPSCCPPPPLLPPGRRGGSERERDPKPSESLLTKWPESSKSNYSTMMHSSSEEDASQLNTWNVSCVMGTEGMQSTHTHQSCVCVCQKQQNRCSQKNIKSRRHSRGKLYLHVTNIMLSIKSKHVCYSSIHVQVYQVQSFYLIWLKL